MKTREDLIKNKKLSIVAIILGLTLAAFGLNSYTETERQIMLLDKVQLDSGIIK